MSDMNIDQQIAELKTIGDEACYPIHTMLSQEPEYSCEWCQHVDVAPSHEAGCIVVDCLMAADTLERLRDVLVTAERIIGKGDALEADYILLEQAIKAARS